MWADPQERYDIFMHNFTEHSWTLVTMNSTVRGLMKTYIQCRRVKCRARLLRLHHASSASSSRKRALVVRATTVGMSGEGVLSIFWLIFGTSRVNTPAR
jgi:hypothetical protein